MKFLKDLQKTKLLRPFGLVIKKEALRMFHYERRGRTGREDAKNSDGHTGYVREILCEYYPVKNIIRVHGAKTITIIFGVVNGWVLKGGEWI